MKNQKFNSKYVKWAFSVTTLTIALAGCGGSTVDNPGITPREKASPPPAAAPTAMINFAGLRNDYVITRNESGYLVTPINSVEKAIQVNADQQLQFKDLRVNLAIAEKANSIKATELDGLIELYIAFFNRVPEADGLAYWIDRYKAGMTMEQIAISFYYAAMDYPDLTGYSPQLSTHEFIRIIYKNVLGRTGDRAPNAEELAYWGNQIDNGSMSRGKLVLAILIAAHDYEADPKWGSMVALLKNKIAVGNQVAVEQGISYNTPQESITQTVRIVSKVSATSTSDALAALDIKQGKLQLNGLSRAEDLGGICTPEAEKSWARTHLDEVYLWYKDVHEAPRDNLSVQSYFDSLLVKSKDRFSYIADANANSNFYNGKVFEFGYLLVTDLINLYVREVDPNSPAGLAGVKRGDRITMVNGETPSYPYSSQIVSALTVGKENTVLNLTIERAGAGQRQNIAIKPFDYSIATVRDVQAFDFSNRKVGYFRLSNFIGPAESALKTTFESLKSQNVNELVLDLRYNPGGYIHIANELSYMIAGDKVRDKVFLSYVTNGKLTAKKVPFYTRDTQNNPLPTLNLNRVFILTGDGSCSSSELVINSLSPFIEVVQIGGTTCGKPYGMTPTINCGKTYSAVEFKSANALGQGDYVNGLKPVCNVDDNVNYSFGSPDENLLSTALTYMTTGQCGSKAIKALPPVPSRPLQTLDPYPWRSNAILRRE